MVDKVVEETRRNRIWDPDRWERIRAQAMCRMPQCTEWMTCSVL